MSLTNTEARYGAVAKTFHWVIALAMIFQFALGVVAEEIPLGTETQVALKANLFSTHKTIGILIFAVALLRVLWAVTQPKPAPMHSERRAETFLAETIHWALYAALIIVPLSGWVIHSASEGYAPIWLPGIQNLPFVPTSTAVEEVAITTHWVFTKVLLGAFLLHAAGALKHALIDRDGTLARMWFGRPPGDLPADDGHEPGAAAPAAAAIYVVGAVAVIAFSAELLGGGDAAEAAQPRAAGGGNWAVQDGTLGLTVTQFGSEVEGSFADWTADIQFSEQATDGSHGTVRVEIAIPTLTLGSVTDEALGADYFNADAHPTALFQGDIVAAGGAYEARGTLELSGDSAEVTLPFTLDIAGDTATMTGETTLDRRDFGIGAGTSDPGTLGFEVPVSVSLTATRAT